MAFLEWSLIFSLGRFTHPHSIQPRNRSGKKEPEI
nr:MAG TPA: hypothetical protein [Caudoviricetes sp.]